MTVLKPCPFCGGDTINEIPNGYDIRHRMSCYLVYNERGQGRIITKDEVDAWNTRANEQQGGE